MTSSLKGMKSLDNDGSHSSLMIYKDENIKDVVLMFGAINVIVDKLITQSKKEEEVLELLKSKNT